MAEFHTKFNIGERVSITYVGQPVGVSPDDLSTIKERFPGTIASIHITRSKIKYDILLDDSGEIWRGIDQESLEIIE